MVITAFGVVLGAIGGYLYWKMVGCRSGTCLIASNKYIMIGYGVLVGGMFTGLFEARQGLLTPTALTSTLAHEAIFSGEYIVVDLRPKSISNANPFENAKHFSEFGKTFTEMTTAFNEGNYLLFICADGTTSQKAGTLFKRKGFRNVFYLEGGINKQL